MSLCFTTKKKCVYIKWRATLDIRPDMFNYSELLTVQHSYFFSYSELEFVKKMSCEGSKNTLYICRRYVPYAHHYNPRFLCFLPQFFTAVYIVDWLILQTIYVLNKEILTFLGLKWTVYNQEWVIMARVW